MRKRERRLKKNWMSLGKKNRFRRMIKRVAVLVDAKFSRRLEKIERRANWAEREVKGKKLIKKFGNFR